MTNSANTADIPTGEAQPEGLVEKKSDGILGLRPTHLVLFVGFTCSLGLVWGTLSSNWVLVATEAPAVLALLAIWLHLRVRSGGSGLAKAAAGIGLLCSIELWVATQVFHASGLALAVTTALSTGVLGVGAVLYRFRRHS